MKYRKETILRHRAQWLEALRSGNYKQGTGYLRNAYDQYCCLGVACDIARIRARLILSDTAYHFEPENPADQFLPPRAQDWLGLSTNDPKVDFPFIADNDEAPFFRGHAIYGPTHLTQMNDEGWTFEEIADAIEEYGFVPQHDLLVTGMDLGE